MAKSESETPWLGAGQLHSAVFVAFVPLFLLVGCAAAGEPEPVAPEPVPALPDGEVFAMITMGTDETGATSVGVDLADMVTGDEAREKAIEDGVIAEGEDLPNDFYIDNDRIVMELLHLADESEIMVISGSDTSRLLQIDEHQLWQLWDGKYEGEAVYGIAPLTPIAMDVTISDGEITSMKAVYLP